MAALFLSLKKAESFEHAHKKLREALENGANTGRIGTRL
jgi:hypothetical protein